MGEVVEINLVTRLDIPVERVIRKAGEADLTGVVVIGWDADGDFYFASSYAAGPEVLWLLELAKQKLLAVSQEDEE